MDRDIAAFVIAAAAVLVTVITGLFENTPAHLLGATWYGFPVAWAYRLVLGPEYYPWRVDGVRLLLDVVFWALIFAGTLFLALRVRARSRVGRPA